MVGPTVIKRRSRKLEILIMCNEPFLNFTAHQMKVRIIRKTSRRVARRAGKHDETHIKL